MVNITVVILALVVVVLGLLYGLVIQRMRRIERTYKRALESNQVRLDQQTSRINILTRALPNLKSHLTSPQQSLQTWKHMVLDESRALLLADEAIYWRFVEKEQAFELDVAKGSGAKSRNLNQRISINQGDVGVVGSRRTPVLMKELEAGKSGMVVPLLVEGNLWGAFQFIRHGRQDLTQGDLDLVAMFVGFLSLSLENREMVQNRERFYLELVQTLADTLDSRDASSIGQTRRAREMARGIAKELDLPKEFTYYLEFAALMHDIGKIAIDDTLLKKPGKLTDEEFAIIKKHPEFGHKILAPVTMLAPVAPMVLYHQEWFNGKGYPEGLKGEEIPLGARIVAILDAWGAMTCDRPWRKALTPEQALAEIKKGAGTQFDPQVVEATIATVTNQGYLAA